MVVNGIVAAVLTVESISDIKTKSISLARLVCYMIVALALNIIMKYQSFISLFGGIIVGVIFLGFGILTKEGIGYGDGAIFICLGAVLGLYDNLRLLMYSLMLAAIVGGIYALVRKKNLKVRIPFIPCVLITYVVMTLVGVIV
jgi:leader peptidase (prepilin peptidase)/N-methyltransferase